MGKEARKILGLGVLLLVLLGGLLLLSEDGHRRLAQLNVDVSQIQKRQLQLAQLERQVSEAESAQRGYLLLNEPAYLEPYLASQTSIPQTLAELQANYQHPPVQSLEKLNHLAMLINARIGQLEEGLRLNRTQGQASTVAYVKEGAGLRTMDEMRAVVRSIEQEHRLALNGALSTVLSDLKLTLLVMAAATLLNAVLLVVLTVLAIRDGQRRAARTAELESRVRARTAELGALSSHLQDVSERDKKELAQELHDSLGGLLVATKMDVAWLRTRLASQDPDIQLRWQRIMRSLDQGVDLKRRVVEQLRPTLLDNMGLFTALRWQFQEICGRAGLRCRDEFPEKEPRLTNAASIALFRVAQESLTNILKHANASEVSLKLSMDDTHLRMAIHDNGRGLPDSFAPGSQAHGLAGMRHRIQALSGSWQARRAESGGTEVLVEIPLARILDTTPENDGA